MLKTMRKTSCIWILFLGIDLFSGNVLAEDEIASEKITLEKLQNKGNLGQTEIDFLDELIHSIFEELPKDRFELVSNPSEGKSECDDLCRVGLAQRHGSSWLVVGTITPFGDGYVTMLKLYKVDTGQLHGSATTAPKSTLEDILEATRTAALDLREKLMPMPRPAALATREATIVDEISSEQTLQPDTVSGSIVGTIIVETNPPGADVYISRDEDELGEPAGQTSLEKKLLPLTYWVTVMMKDHETVQREIRVDPSETETIKIPLVRIYPPNPYKVGGHFLFWPGLALSGLGFFFAVKAKLAAEDYNNYLDQEAKDSSRYWAGNMWLSFGFSAAMMTTGIVLWAISPGDKEWVERQQRRQSAWISPAGDGGMALYYSGRF